MWMLELNNAILAELKCRTWTTRAAFIAAVGKQVFRADAIWVRCETRERHFVDCPLIRRASESSAACHKIFGWTAVFERN